MMTTTPRSKPKHTVTRNPRETTAQQRRRMAWFADAKIGLFIHWGPYALLGGVWNDQDVPGVAEHIRSNAKIPHAQYAQQALTFNPVAFDQDAWASLAPSPAVATPSSRASTMMVSACSTANTRNSRSPARPTAKTP